MTIKNESKLFQEDKAFRKAAHLWLEKEIRELESQTATPEEDAFISYSLKNILPYSKTKKRSGKLPKLLTIAACIVLTLFLGLSAAVAISEPFRSFVANLIIQQEMTYTEYNKQINMPDGWSGVYFPTFIPNGFSCVSLDYLNRAVIFEDENGKFFQFVEYRSTDTVQIDTEDAIVETVYIQGMNATLVRNDDMLYILWDHIDRLFLVNGNIEENIALQIAESIYFYGS